MKFSETQTYNNLCKSFTAESQEGARYQFMAKAAMQQQYTALQKVFKDLAKNEMAHAEQFFNKIKEHSGTEADQNVRIDATYSYAGGELQKMMQDTVKIEEHQQKVVYKNFAKVAADEGFADVAELYEMIAKIEGDHAMIVKQIAGQLKDGVLYKTQAKQAWKCSECGHEVEDTSAPKTCPVCQMPQGTYYLKTDLARYLKR
jgi:rubrerythrin